jgi:predicted MPP superfamily phosphohydrolase
VLSCVLPVTIENMALQNSSPSPLITRRRLLAAGLTGALGLGLYAGEGERHWIDLTRQSFSIPGLPEAFDGFRIVQLSDIHLKAWTEEWFLRDAVARINALNPDAVFLTGDFVSQAPDSPGFPIECGWKCAAILRTLTCPHVYGILGNHDILSAPDEIARALTENHVQMLRNASLPIERDNARFWLAGVDDPLKGIPDPDRAIPDRIRHLAAEPVILLAHCPDYVDELLTQPVGQSVRLMLSGHTHGGQVRIPFAGPITLPPMGRKYVEGHFQFGNLQLYVNRGIGTVGVPFRFDCRPEITEITLHRA